MTVTRYHPVKDREEWNQLIDSGVNSTFLFNRNFMDYHLDRISDYSLVIRDEKANLVSVLPASLSDEKSITSHAGLTYGGFVLQEQSKLFHVLSIVHATLEFLNLQGVQTLQVKHFPSFYNFSPTDELDYAYFLLDATLYRRDTAMVIDQQHRIAYSGNIRREGAKAQRAGAIIMEDINMSDFWNKVLVPNLQSRFQVKPIHSLEEISQLKQAFPNKIRQFNVYLDGVIMAGTTLFITPSTVHCQYISATAEGRKSGCLNYLFKYLIDEVFSSHRYFDFGIVNENEGYSVNNGMLFWKESFGGRSHKHDFYRIATNAHTKLALLLN